MSVTESDAHTPGTPVHAEQLEHAEHPAHPSDWTYVKIALILGVLTGLEVFTYFESVVDWGPFLMPALLVLMAIKFYLIAAYFMHLKFDPKALRRMFAGGLVLAIAVYVVVLIVFEFFEGWA
jgi:cytochrome c oxidase subunit 4